MVDGIPLRGAISIGPLTSILNQWPSETHNFQYSLFGKAIVDAIDAEKKQEWCGCEITQAAIESYKKNCAAGESLIEKNEIVFYPVPRKDGEISGYVVDWVNHHQAPIDVQTVTDAFAFPCGPPNASDWEKFKTDEWPKVKIKLCNTLKFVKHVKSIEKQSFIPWRSLR